MHVMSSAAAAAISSKTVIEKRLCCTPCIKKMQKKRVALRVLQLRCWQATLGCGMRNSTALHHIQWRRRQDLLPWQRRDDVLECERQWKIVAFRPLFCAMCTLNQSSVSHCEEGKAPDVSLQNHFSATTFINLLTAIKLFEIWRITQY